MRRILSLWLPTFATDRIARGLTPPLAAGTPLVTRLSDRGRLTVAAVNAAARAKRLVPGMGLADARALEPQVHVVDADPEGDAAALGRLADWARRYTPWTAVDPADPPGFGNGPGLLLDITGCAHLLGGNMTCCWIWSAGWPRQGSRGGPPSPTASAPPGRRPVSAPSWWCRRAVRRRLWPTCRCPPCAWDPIWWPACGVSACAGWGS
nr:hypothetical protein [Nitrospirillum sp. BR 11164]